MIDSQHDAPEDLTIRCFCQRKPILAVCGRDRKTGDLFVHVRAMKQDRIQAEVIITSGVVRIHCRECLRWHIVTIKQPKVEHKPEPLPASLVIA